MSKNKLMRTIALLLTAVTLLPIAHAQASGGFNWIVLIINAAVVFIVLFVLQAFLIPQKNDKEKTSVWVIMIIASLLVAFLFGSSGFIWKTGPLASFFNIYVLGNALLIGIVLYFALGFLKIQNLQSPEGKTGSAILIFLVAVFFAVQLGNQWIWQKEVVRSGITFLFADGKGILHPKGGLVVFVTSFVLFAFFFENFLLKGAKPVLNYGMALIFAVHLAIPPANPMKDVIMLGEVFFVLILRESLKSTIPNDKYFASWLISIFLIGWASTVMTMNSPDNRGLLGNVGCVLVNCKEAGAAAATAGTGGWLWTIGKFGLILFLIILVLFGGGLWAVGRGEKRKGKLWNTLNKYGMGPIMEWLRKTPITPIKWIASWWTRKDPYEEGTLPKVFKSLRAELMTLMNYQTRVHTYFGKANSVVELQNQAKGLESHFASAPKTYDDMRNSLDNYRFGKEQEIEGQKVFGWSNNREFILKVFESLINDLAEVKEVTLGTEKGINERVSAMTNNLLSRMDTAYSQYITNVKRFGLIHRLKSIRLSLIDLLALYGVYKHYYRFANENALFEIWDVEIDEGHGYKKNDKGEVEKDSNGNHIRTSDGVLWSIKSMTKSIEYENKRKSIEYEIKNIIFQEIRAEVKKRMEQSLKIKLEAELYSKTEEYVKKRYEEYKNKLPESERNKDFSKEINRSIQKIYDEKKKNIPGQIKAELTNRELEVEEAVEKEFEKKVYQDQFGTAKELKEYRLGFVAEVEDIGSIRHEVDYQGFVLKDMHEIEVGHQRKGYIRRVKIEDIEDFPSKSPELSKLSWIAEQIKQEWDFFIEDLRWGTYHPHSRSHTDYTSIIDEKRYGFENVGKTPPSKNQGRAAFDLEALKIPGKFVYWGRKNYWDRAVEPKNPYPTMSTVGISQLLTKLIRLRCSETVADKYLSTFVWDTGADKPPFTTVLGKESGEKHGN